MQSLYAILFLALVPGQASSGSCGHITVCPNFSQNIVKGVKETPDFHEERIIGKERHWNGIVPTQYRVNLNFQNFTDYTGYVDIDFRIVNSTKCILINQGFSNPKVDYSKIGLSNCNEERNTHLTKGCIEKITFMQAKETLELELKDAVLEKDQIYTISFGRIEGQQKKGPGLTLCDVQGPAIVTLFQMRRARTVLPCFDHPSLKAEFSLCIEYPAEITVASNTEVKQSVPKVDNRTLDCFQTTPVMSSYLFAFALMQNYASKSITTTDGLKIELLSPKEKIAERIWILTDTIPAIEYMEKITKFKYPMKRLAFVEQYDAPVGGMENFGLITLSEGEESDTLYHEIVHNWVGNVMTISNWKELCLQEGLTTYFTWKLLSDLKHEPLEKKTKAGNNEHQSYQPYALMDFMDLDPKIFGYCYDRSALLYHVATQLCNFESIENFLAKLVEKARFGTADIDLYDQAMAETCKIRGTDQLVGPGMIKGWFLQSGPLYLTASQSIDARCITVQQKVYDEIGNPIKEVRPRPVPVEIHSFLPDGTSKIYHGHMKSGQEKLVHCNNSTDTAFLIDPNGNVVTRKTYTAANYLRILQYHQKNPHMLTHDQLTTFATDFCDALLHNVLPLDNDQNPSEWLEVVKLIKSNIGTKECQVCLNTKEDNQYNPKSRSDWNTKCSKLRLMKVISMQHVFDAKDESKIFMRY